MSTTSLHLAIIPDGNRRWAKEHELEAIWKGHEVAIENFRTLTDWCRNDPRVSVLTVWCFSTENWKRDPKEVKMLMTMLEAYLKKEGDDLKKNKTRFVHSGRRDRIPASLKKVIEDTEANTKDETGFTLHLAVDYGGKDEVLRAMQKYMNDPAAGACLLAGRSTAAKHDPERAFPPAVADDNIRKHLDHPELPDIDVILRSSNEHRTSNFFLWQTVYSEWVFSPKYFPDIGITDLDEALKEYDRRKRRFGG